MEIVVINQTIFDMDLYINGSTDISKVGALTSGTWTAGAEGSPWKAQGTNEISGKFLDTPSPNMAAFSYSGIQIELISGVSQFQILFQPAIVGGGQFMIANCITYYFNSTFPPSFGCASNIVNLST